MNLSVTFTVHGALAEDLQRAADRECLRFFGGPCAYDIEARPAVQTTDGQLVMYEGTVTARAIS